MKEKYDWNLEDIFKTNDDFEKNQKKLSEILKNIEKYQGSLNTSDKIYECYNLYEKALELYEKVYAYGMLKYHLNMAESKNIKLYKKVQNIGAEFEKATAFITPEITNIDEDFARWYTDIVLKAELADYTDTKGCIAIRPYGYAIWENIQNYADRKFKETGVKNTYFPVLIPESLLQKEKDHVEGFAPEVAWVTNAGGEDLEEKLCIRPTSETIITTMYSKWLSSWRDLPYLYNQWCNVLRWEKETRPFLRSREFLWQEGHTIHETKKEAEKETKDMLNIYKTFFEEYLAIPVVTGRKTESEKFAGAEYTLTVEALMYNGISLQSATSHFFGQKFSKAYDIKFADRNNNLSYVYQTSWGSSTRMLGALIMVHSDDNGLVLPPKIAPTKVVIIPIGNVKEEVEKIYEKLKTNNINVIIDNSDKTPGFKFAEAEVLGIPIRIEVGERDLKENKITFVRRDTNEKIEVKLDELSSKIGEILELIQQNMFDTCKKRMEAKTTIAHNLNEFQANINKEQGFIKAMWCGNEECEAKIKELTAAKSRCMPFEQEHIGDTCVCCGKPATKMVIWGRQY